MATLPLDEQPYAGSIPPYGRDSQIDGLLPQASATTYVLQLALPRGSLYSSTVKLSISLLIGFENADSNLAISGREYQLQHGDMTLVIAPSILHCELPEKAKGPRCIRPWEENAPGVYPPSSNP